MAKNSPYPQTDRELIRRIERSAGHRAGYKQLVRELGLGGGRERRLLLEQLARITARGELVKTEAEQWAIPSAAPEKTARKTPSKPNDAGLEWGTRLGGRATRDRLVAGKLDLHRDGYGFVRPNGSTNREDDLFIPPNELNGAMQGDEVLVDEAPPGRDGRRSGRIARVLTRRNPTVVGIFHYARARGRRGAWDDAPVVQGNYVTPLDERMTGAPGGGAILIPEGAEIVTASVTQMNRVLGEEAQSERRRWSVHQDEPERAGRHDWLEGLAVDVEITDFPAPGRPAKGRVIEVLGPPDGFGVDVEIVIRKHHLPHVFPTNVLAEASEAAGWGVDPTLPPESGGKDGAPAPGGDLPPAAKAGHGMAGGYGTGKPVPLTRHGAPAEASEAADERHVSAAKAGHGMAGGYGTGKPVPLTRHGAPAEASEAADERHVSAAKAGHGMAGGYGTGKPVPLTRHGAPAEASEAADERHVSAVKAGHGMAGGYGTGEPVPLTRHGERATSKGDYGDSGASLQNDGRGVGRRDFRGLPIVTIDGETARDFDDAVLARPLANGNWELQVHIADVSHYVRPGTALDLEARLRGTSVYFPDRAVPMLPPQLSSGMCSLRPDEDRLVLSCTMEIDGRGEVVGYEVCEGMIRSAKRMTYTQVQAILDSGTDKATDVDKAVRAEFAELVTNFERMHELALKLNAKRNRRGSIDFDLPEPVIEFDPEGNMESIVRSERGWAHRLIEEFMLSANECVATWIEQNAIPGIYRIHEMPDPKRIVDFEETASGFGYSLGFASLPVKQMTMKADRRDVRKGGGGGRPAKTHEVEQSIPVTPQMYQRLTAKIAGKPEERILAYLMLRSLKQARYSEKNEGHFALASPCYTHFTSPIRRYPDLIVHRLVRELLRAGADARGGAIKSTDPQPWGRAMEGSGTPSAAKAGHGLGSVYGTGKPVPLTRRGSAVRGERGGGIPRRHVAGAKAPSLSASVSAGTEVPAYLKQGGYGQGSDGLGGYVWEPIAEAELAAIAVESSQAERRADDAERELMEWKKMRFMEDRVGEDFGGIILSCTKYGFFVELDDLFIEGLVPIASLSGWGSDERYVFRDTDKQIVSTRGGKAFKMGQRVRVLLDRIDRQQRRLQFALVVGAPAVETKSLRKGKAAKKAEAAAHTSPERTGKRKSSGGKQAGKRGAKRKGKRK